MFVCPCSVIIRQTESIFSYIRDWSFLQEQKTETFLSKQLPHIPLYWTVKKNCPRSLKNIFYSVSTGLQSQEITLRSQLAVQKQSWASERNRRRNSNSAQNDQIQLKLIQPTYSWLLMWTLSSVLFQRHAVSHGEPCGCTSHLTKITGVFHIRLHH